MDEQMKEQPWRVLVRTDDAGRVVAINSSAFVQDTDGWEEIDAGWGDRFHHAQGNYLPGPLVDERGVYRYKLDGDIILNRTQEEMDGDWAAMYEEATPTVEQRLDVLEEALEMILTGVTE